ncbi:plasma membrane ATP-binding cassette transporter [Cyberlindnera jadinii NRRL Y-1542]|uniref:Plasma membrane ATP-binding cassette transporter n=1 Tax=Cyberlindnera jadinii (strain ATCC 18201 / CBS 1600 / BCRC 20928 / JCM 3617 / NBRC 0987 / NRRL Y-1542) TaxID=983966 RepID=A0A1E4RW18_CYBJN|nr:plasma membrane ATP-binding cassette transporter [Cyberlindnera jadinii NRRL Y-1542]ODV71464.1 plasma membrane ATP-binding cassette transporter [Cyberlindnera jadinii NRRL Y-1542]
MNSVESADKNYVIVSDGSEKLSPVPPLQRRLLTPFLSKEVPPIPVDEERVKYPYLMTNPFSTVFFTWLNPLLKVGYKRTLSPNDLFKIADKDALDYTYSTFERHLDEIIQKDRDALKLRDPSITEEELEAREYPKNAILKALLKTFKWEYSFAVFFKLLSDTAQVLTPLLSRALITYVQDKTVDPGLPVNNGVGYAIGVTFMLAVTTLCTNHFLYLSLTVGLHAKSILTTAVLKKSFKASSVTRHTFTNGRVTSLISADLARVDLAFGFQPYVITAPVPIIVTIALLIINIGVSSLAGIAMFLVALFVIGACSGALMALRKKVNKFTDSRISYMREILQNMKIIKLYSWEDAYEKTVTDERNNEIGVMLKMVSVRNFLMAFAISLPSVVSMVAFLVLYGVSQDQNPANIFTSLYLFSLLAGQIMMVPMALSTATDAKIGLERLRLYLQSGEVQSNDDDKGEDGTNSLPEDVAIQVTNASFIWEKFEDEDNEAEETPETTSSIERLDELSKHDFEGFSNINFSIKKSEVVLITGPIGSGKSSLLLALAGQMTKTSGSLKTAGSLLSAGQPWIQNATVKENILFGEPFNQDRYQQVVRVCALEDDLQSFTAGDATEVGERGITLSGGQKARINLARAVYANKDIILLDDVLSAVDSRVGKIIVDECFKKFLRKKTIVLATHQLSLVHFADRAIFLNGDGSINIGTVEELSKTSSGFLKLMEYSSRPDSDTSNDGQNEKLEGILSGKSVHHNPQESTLIEDEERAVNAIEWSVYKAYLHEGQGKFGVFAIPLIAMFMTFDVFLTIFVNVWLTYWINDSFPGRSDGFYIGFYVMFVVLSIVAISSEFIMMGYFFSTASRRLYLKVLKRVLHTPMHYLDVTPMGCVLNRFTKDTDSLDNEIGQELTMLVYPGAILTGTVILCVVYLPWFAIALPPLLVVTTATTNFYVASSREVKRIEALQRSHVFNNLHEILNGLQTLKAYNALERFMDKNKHLIDRMNEAYILVIANQRWISIHLELVSCLLVLVVALLSVFRVFNINAASVGLIINYVMQVATFMSLVMRSYTSVENEMNSVERLCFYAHDLEQEPPYRINETRPRPSWPEHGAIEFQNVSMRYRYGSPLVLRNLSISVKGGEKIGICGRTGAGKSSIMNVLFRLSEPAEGTVLIDGVDTSKLGLYDLRSKLSIIPQDPVLFRGTIRKNLDPFEQSEDSALWEALRKAGLIDTDVLRKAISQHPDDPNRHKFHLDQLVEDDGSNFSNGERQLIALARALVRDSKILVLDEATSSVDYETDAKIQNTIAEEFSECTILCIAHRLNTILNYDRILVLEQGKVEQFDTPWALFNQDGIFRQMCERSGIKSSERLSQNWSLRLDGA